MPRPILARAASLAALLLGAAAAAGCPSAPKGPQEMPEKKEDAATKLAYYEESAQTYYEGGRYQQSVMMWRKVLEIEPGRQKAEWGLAKSLAMIDTPPSLRESEQIFAEIVNLDWSHPELGDRRHEVLKDYAEVYLSLADYYERDIVALKAKLENPGPDAPKVREDIAKQTARRDELLNKAIPLYQEVLQLSPSNPYAIAGLAKAYLMTGQDAQGVAYARQYVDISVQSQREWKRQLDDYKRERGADLTTDQISYFEGRIKGASKKEMSTRMLLGSVYIRNRDFKAAIAEYDRVLEIDATNAAAYVERAQAYAGMGNYRVALLDLETYLKVTDPVALRGSRIRAAELMDEYRLQAAMQPRTPPPPPAAPATGPGGFPPPAPPPTPAPPAMR